MFQSIRRALTGTHESFHARLMGHIAQWIIVLLVLYLLVLFGK